MATQLEIVHRRFAPQIKRPGVMWRIQVGQDENLHPARGYGEEGSSARRNVFELAVAAIGRAALRRRLALDTEPQVI
jgi:hypothetical protein